MTARVPMPISGWATARNPRPWASKCPTKWAGNFHFSSIYHFTFENALQFKKILKQLEKIPNRNKELSRSLDNMNIEKSINSKATFRLFLLSKSLITLYYKITRFEKWWKQRNFKISNINTIMNYFATTFFLSNPREIFLNN